MHAVLILQLPPTSLSGCICVYPRLKALAISEEVLCLGKPARVPLILDWPSAPQVGILDLHRKLNDQKERYYECQKNQQLHRKGHLTPVLGNLAEQRTYESHSN